MSELKFEVKEYDHGKENCFEAAGVDLTDLSTFTAEFISKTFMQMMTTSKAASIIEQGILAGDKFIIRIASVALAQKSGETGLDALKEMFKAASIK